MLFDRTELPRARPVKRMHVLDAGHIGGGQKGIRFKCGHCGHDTGWIADEWTITENRRGQPCPVCNAGNEGRIVMDKWAAMVTGEAAQVVRFRG